MKKIKFTLLALCLMSASAIFVSCNDTVDTLKELTTVDVPLFDAPIVIPVDLDKSAETKGEGMVAFSGTSSPISLDSEMFQTLRQYNAESVTLSVSDVKIKITTTTASGTTVSGFSSDAIGEGVDFSYAKDGNIELGVEFSDSQLTSYIKNVMLNIQGGKTVTISIEGMTDIDPTEVTAIDMVVATIIPSMTAKIQLLK